MRLLEGAVKAVAVGCALQDALVTGKFGMIRREGGLGRRCFR